MCEQRKTVKVLGHELTLMTRDDYDGFAGADPGSYIGGNDEVVWIWSPSARILSEIDVDGHQTDWNCTKIN